MFAWQMPAQMQTAPPPPPQTACCWCRPAASKLLFKCALRGGQGADGKHAHQQWSAAQAVRKNHIQASSRRTLADPNAATGSWLPAHGQQKAPHGWPVNGVQGICAAQGHQGGHCCIGDCQVGQLARASPISPLGAGARCQKGDHICKPYSLLRSGAMSWLPATRLSEESTRRGCWPGPHPTTVGAGTRCQECSHFCRAHDTS